tara:strand:+ start:507 stop:914 length:408 start_codon:yes stop_codon:yes gene_type:complete
MARQKTTRDADEAIRSNIPTIRDQQLRKDLVRANSSNQVFQLEGNSYVNVGKTWDGALKTIHIANTSQSIAATISLYISRPTEPTIIYIIKNFTIQVGEVLVLEESDLAIDSTDTMRFILTAPNGTATVDIIIRL